MFSSRLSLSALIELCRVLKHYLGAGLSLVDVFEQQAKRGPARVRPIASRIAAVLAEGGSLESALKPETKHFPPLFVSLGSVAERTGMLPEVFGELERYYLRQQQLQRSFYGRIAWPVIQFVLATLVLALVIFIMGQLSPNTPTGQRFDPLGLGLFGASGAIIFLSVVYGTLAGVFLLYKFGARLLGGTDALDRFLLSVPALGPCLRSLAIGRFCLALRLTHEAGTSIKKALRLSFRATGNRAFVADGAVAETTVAGGESIAMALMHTQLFPDDFERVVAVAEESGTLSEVMKHEGDHYYDEASRKMAVLTSVAGYAVWGMTGLFIVVFIFRIYGSYLNLLNSI